MFNDIKILYNRVDVYESFQSSVSRKILYNHVICLQTCFLCRKSHNMVCFPHQDPCLWSQSTAASATSWTSFARRLRRLWTLLWTFPTLWRTTTRTSAIRNSSLEGTSPKHLHCNDGGFVKNTQSLSSVSADIPLCRSPLVFFPPNSDSGISSTPSSSYLEMRPSQPPNMETSRGKKAFSPNPNTSWPWVFLTLFLSDSCQDSVCEETGDWPLDIDDLLRFSFQVAQGLDFLAAKNVRGSKCTNIQNRKHYCDHLQQQQLLSCP